MTRGIAQDLFASVMRMPTGQRADVLEFLGQSASIPRPASVKRQVFFDPEPKAGIEDEAKHATGD
jgi:hypothetical protein